MTVTRTLLDAALQGALDDVETVVQAQTGLRIPVAVEGVDSTMLDPRNTWDKPEEYDIAAGVLRALFQAHYAEKNYAALGITAQM